MSAADTDTASTARPALSKSRWLRPLLIAAGVAALWTGVVGTWLPQWVRPHVEAAASEALGTPVTVARLQLQPWTGLLTLEGIKVGPAAAPLLSLAQAQAQPSLESIWRLAPVLRRVTLVQPDIWIERQSAERFNFSAIAEKLMAPGQAEEADAEPQRFAVFNIVVRDGRVRYTDRVLAQTHRIDQLQIGVPFVSNLPSQIHVDVEPLLSAKVDGSPLRLKGRTLPFQDDLKSEIDIRLDAVDVPHWLAAVGPLLPAAWRPQASGGKMEVAVTVGFAMRAPPAVPLLSIKGRVQLDGLGLALSQAPVLGDAELGWGSLKVEGIDAEPLARKLALGKVDLDGVTWRSGLDLVGKPSESKPQSASAPAPAPTASDWSWRIGQIDVRTGRIDVQPSLVAEGKAALHALATKTPSAKSTQSTPRWPALDQARVSLKGLDSRAKAPAASWQLELRDEHGAHLQAQGKVQPAARAVEAQADLQQLKLAPWLAPLNAALKLPMTLAQGELALQAGVAVNLLPAAGARSSASASASAAPAAAADATIPQARLTSGRVRLQGIEARASQAGSKDRLGLAELTLDGIQARVDLADEPALRQLTMDSLLIERLDAALTRGSRGEWLGMAPDTASTPATASATRAIHATNATATAQQPLIRLGTLRCEACSVHVNDQAVTPAAQFDVSRLGLYVEGLSSQLSGMLKVELDTLAQGKGQLRFKGDVRPEPLSLQGRVQVAGLDLRAVQPYIDPLVNIRLAAARASADGQLSLEDPGRGGLGARYKGRVGLADVRVQDRVNEADFVRWQALSIDGLDVNWADQALDANLGRIALKDFYGRVIVNANGDVNLAGVMRQQAGGQARSLTTPEAVRSGASAPVPAAASAPIPASAPASASLNAATMAQAATVRPSPSPSTSTSLPPKLRWQQIQLAKGRIDFTDNFIKPNYSARLTQIEGEISAVSSTKPEPATIKVSGAVDDAAPLRITGQLHPLGPRLFTDIEGSAKGIELTRLTPYAARYAGHAIEKGSLSVTVHYKVDGGKLEASNQIFLDQLTFGEKTDSPDALNLPVRLAVSLLQNSRGEIDVNLPISGSLDDPEFSVGGIIWRVIVNLVTKAVTAPFALLAGGDTAELGLVPFEPGSARLSEAATQRLDTLAAKLQDRPALKLEATGRADPVADVEGLRRAHVNRLLRTAKARETGQPAADVRVGDEERAKWLSAAYKAADIPKPRNLIGLAKTLSGPEMEALLKASATVDEQALRQLANRRGDAVKAYLADKLPPERVLLTASKIGPPDADEDKDDKAPRTRVQFAVK